MSGKNEFSLLRPRLRADVADAVHTHDFAELFWVESGAGLHRINGEFQRLEPGTVVFIRPRDCHTFNSRLSSELRMVNIAFPLRDLQWFQQRYDARLLPWRAGHLPCAETLPKSALVRLNNVVAEIMHGPLTTLELDYLLISVLREVGKKQSPIPSGALPGWLIQAIQAVRSNPELLAGGCEGFVALCQKSREHVCRTVRDRLGISPSELVNRCRLDHAAFLLQDPERTIVEVALESGFGNVSYFYRRFRECFGRTPGELRGGDELVSPLSVR